MKKTYTLNVAGKNRERLLDASKHDIRKYIKRERAKALPEGTDFWDFDCKLGASDAEVTGVHIAAMMTSIDTLLANGSEQFYVEVVTKHGHRTVRPPVETTVVSLEQGQGD